MTNLTKASYLLTRFIQDCDDVTKAIKLSSRKRLSPKQYVCRSVDGILYYGNGKVTVVLNDASEFVWNCPNTKALPMFIYSR